MRATITAVAFVCLNCVAHAQSAPGLDIDGEFAHIKESVAARYRELRAADLQYLKTADPKTGFLKTKVPPTEIGIDGIIAVFDCGFSPGLDYKNGGDAATGSLAASPAWAAALFSVAKTMAVLQETASYYGYPEDVYARPLAEYERKGIAKAKALARKDIRDAGNLDAALPAYPENIVAAMEAFRVKTRKGGLRLVPQEGCGAGESAVQVVAEPAARLIRLVPEFFASVCEKSGRPLKGDACPYWRDAPQKSKFGASGLYVYHVFWSDGAERLGKVDFDKLNPDGSEEFATFVITR